MGPFSATRRMWRSRWLCASMSSVPDTADARGGMTMSGTGSGWRLAMARYTGSASYARPPSRTRSRPHQEIQILYDLMTSHGRLPERQQDWEQGWERIIDGILRSEGL